MKSLPMLTTILFVMTSGCDGVTDEDIGRTFVLNSDDLTWGEAHARCQALGGHLATIDGPTLVPEMEYEGKWTLWVGLKVTSPSNMTWADGKKVDWTNWRGNPDWTKDVGLCVSVATLSPYSWVLMSCNTLLPSLCEVPGGTCRFTLTHHASLVSLNDKIVSGRDTCLQECIATRELDCRSVEVHRVDDVCQFSTSTRWSNPSAFVRGAKNWDFHQWTCVNGTYLTDDGVTPNGADGPVLQSTTVPSIPTTG
ncbi:lymphocyte antigen 75-like [Babylonia areolata]|uniref:lymphocyte antigen 75-like n=1 Tax=Babylonia areolata TaxID=304850 RepID=UPI003FD0F0E5